MNFHKTTCRIDIPRLTGRPSTRKAAACRIQLIGNTTASTDSSPHPEPQVRHCDGALFRPDSRDPPVQSLTTVSSSGNAGVAEANSATSVVASRASVTRGPPSRVGQRAQIDPLVTRALAGGRQHRAARERAQNIGAETTGKHPSDFFQEVRPSSIFHIIRSSVIVNYEIVGIRVPPTMAACVRIR
jgi:hypothetical protein